MTDNGLEGSIGRRFVPVLNILGHDTKRLVDISLRVCQAVVAEESQFVEPLQSMGF